MAADDGSRAWVNANATQHIGEAIANSGAFAPISAQVQLTSLQQAISSASRQGITLGQRVVAGGWQLEFRQSAADALPVLVHARFVGGG